jgi:membrane protein implicated in regulation of membrane protease activity
MALEVADWTHWLIGPLVWVCVALALVVLEIQTGTLYLAMLGGAALLTAVFAWYVPEFLYQMLVFAMLALVGLFVVRPVFQRLLSPASGEVSNADAVVGQEVLLEEPVSRVQPGRVKIIVTGETWTAFLETDTDETLPAGTVAVVTDVQGVRLRIRAAAAIS